MKCSACGAANPAEQKFCNECAAPFKKRCSKCGYENPPTAKFCGECAAPLGESASTTKPKQSNASPIRVAETPAPENIEGERKTATALFADIRGSTALMEGLDPEAAHAIVEPVLRLMIEAVHRYEGYVARSTGDGIFALFGAPVAHEDHPQRALYAALRLQEELKRYATRLREAGELPIEARVGVNTGEVVAYSVETDGKLEYRLVGHTANLASRMEALAPTGSIAISEDTRRLVEGYFALKALGPTTQRSLAAYSRYSRRCGSAARPRRAMSTQVKEQQIQQGHPELFTTYGDTSPFAEAYRSLRINLFQGNGRPLWSLGITGAAPGHGSSTTAANLALIMGEVRSRVVLVDCDLHKPSVHRIFEIPNTVGFSSVLKGEARVEDALHTVGSQPLLKVMPAGPSVSNPAALLQPTAIDALFKRLKPETDLLILDMPSVRVVSYTCFLASLVDGLLLVVRSGTTAIGVERIMQRQLKGAHIIGAVLNKVPTDGSEVASYRDYALYNKKR